MPLVTLPWLHKLSNTVAVTAVSGLHDHKSYLGIDVDNIGCRADLSTLGSYKITSENADGSGPFTCTPNVN
jgi:hypothetical protein